MTAQHRTGIELAVSAVVFSLRPHPETGELTLWLPLVRRIREPYEDSGPFPGALSPPMRIWWTQPAPP